MMATQMVLLESITQRNYMNSKQKRRIQEDESARKDGNSLNLSEKS